MHTPDWNDIRHFITLVEQHTLTAAAEALDVGHSTVSRRIARLEAVLGLRLFDRIGKRYLPTAHGLRLYRQACELDKGMAVFRRMAREEGEAVAEVVLTAPPAVIHALLPPHLPAFCRAHPHIRLIVQSSPNLLDLHQRQADIALRLSYPGQNDLTARRLRSLRFGFYAHADYLRSVPQEQWRFILLATDNAVSRWAEEQTVGQAVLLRCNDFLLIRQAVDAKLGVGLLPDDDVREHKHLRPLAADHPPLSSCALAVPLFMVMHEDVRRSPAIRAAADFWAQALGEPWDE